MRLLNQAARHVAGNVVSYLALLIAMSGTAYAAATISSGDVVDDSLRSVDLKNGNVRQVDLAPAQPWREVNPFGSSQPAFGHFDTFLDDYTWMNATSDGVYETAGFYRDPYGVVHLKGRACVDSSDIDPGCNTVEDPNQTRREVTIFTLPPGYRPAHKMVFAAMSAQGAIQVDVWSSGEVTTDDNAPMWLALDGITLRCAPSGSSGCP